MSISIRARRCLAAGVIGLLLAAVHVPANFPALPGVEPVEIRATLLIMPFSTNGEVTEQGLHFASALGLQWRRSLPRSIGLIPEEFALEMIRERHQRHTSFPYPLTAGTLERVMRYTRPTHVVHGSWEEADDQWHVEVVLEHGGISTTRTLTLPPRHDIAAAASITDWILEEGGLELTDVERERLRRPYFGGVYDSMMGDEILAMVNDPIHHPAWEDFAAMEGARDLYVMERVYKALDAGELDFAVGLVPRHEPPPDATSADLLPIMVLTETGEYKDRHVEALDFIMAAFPGFHRLAASTIGFMDGSDLGPRDMESLRQSIIRWHDANPTSPYLQAMVGEFHSRLAWKRRGTEFAHRVPHDAMADFRRHTETARLWLESSQREGGFHPPHAATLIGTYGAMSRHDSARALFEDVVKEYPLHTQAWAALLNFMRPRWGGTIEEGITLIDRALESAPDFAMFGFLPLAFHVPEGRYMRGDAEIRDAMEDYFRRYPKAKEQVEEGFRRVFSEGATAGSALSGLYYAMMMDEDSRGRGAARHHPDLHRRDWSFMPVDYRPMAHFILIFAYLDHGYWEEMVEIVDKAVEMDRAVKAGEAETEQLVFMQQGWAEAYLALAHANIGNRDRARAYLTRARDDGLTVYVIQFVQLLLMDDPRALEERLRRRIDEDDSRLVDLKMLAVLLGRSGRVDEARKLREQDEAYSEARAWYSLDRLVEAELGPRKSDAPQDSD